MSQTKTAEFGKWRSMLWPVHGFEFKKLIPMLLLMFFINFNYTILRDTKDALIVTAPGSSAAAIPFLKVWGVLPFAVVFMLVFSKLSNIMSKQRLFYTTVCGFLAFFAFFSLVLYPARDVLHPSQLADQLQASLPEGFSGLIAIFRNWTFALFYIMSELWGSMCLSLLFWGFANDITRVSESKRFYAMFGIGANLAMLPSGQLIKYFASARAAGVGADPWTFTLNSLTLLVIGAGAATMGVYWWINKYILTDKRFYDPGDVKQKKAKPKLPLKESFAYLMKSKYLLCLLTLVVGYGVSIQLVEVTWKNQVGAQYPTPNEYVAFMGAFSQFTAVLTIFMMLFVGGNVIRKFGWGKGALTTPVILLVTGVAFFAFVIFKGQLGGLITALGSTPLMLAVIFGTAQNIASKATKYSLFDPTKEMAYIPLDQESKVKGKAAIDVVGARFGKAGGALINQGLIIATGGIAFIAPYVAVIMLFILGGWIVAPRSLGKQFGALTAQRDAEAAAEAAAKEAPAETETAKSPQPTT
ncbi:MAG: NTP/NDP exchange transporter [Gammaproteobacteria bacterium]|nr:NTP/NDP exchange transporter [Gammaproteobacteria bacterium]